MSDDNSWVLLLLGPGSGVGLYWTLYRYYRNTDKSHAFERETKIDAKPVTGADHDQKVGTNSETRERRIKGDNGSNYRARVGRMRSDSG